MSAGKTRAEIRIFKGPLAACIAMDANKPGTKFKHSIPRVSAGLVTGEPREPNTGTTFHYIDWLIGILITSWPLVGNEGMNPQYTNVKVEGPSFPTKGQPDNSLLYSLYNWVGFHPPCTANKQGELVTALAV